MYAESPGLQKQAGAMVYIKSPCQLRSTAIEQAKKGRYFFTLPYYLLLSKNLGLPNNAGQ